MKVKCGRCGKQLDLVGDFRVTEKIFLDGLARYGWQPTLDPGVFICRECRHAEGNDIEEFVREVVAAYVELRAEVASLAPAEREAGALSGFAQIERLMRALSGHVEFEEAVRARVPELLRELHGDEASAWVEATAQHFAQSQIDPIGKRNGGT